MGFLKSEIDFININIKKRIVRLLGFNKIVLCSLLKVEIRIILLLNYKFVHLVKDLTRTS